MAAYENGIDLGSSCSVGFLQNILRFNCSSFLLQDNLLVSDSGETLASIALFANDI